MKASSFFKTSPMYDSVETIPDRHYHRCHMCGNRFSCKKDRPCTIEDQYAVCFSPVCIERFEADTPCEICGYEECRCGREYLNVDSDSTLGLSR